MRLRKKKGATVAPFSARGNCSAAGRPAARQKKGTVLLLPKLMGMRNLTIGVLAVLVALGSASLYASLAQRDAEPMVARCNPHGICKACKNCKYCKHCSKDGGTCSVCR
jgi:hypothetical protein